ncbi:MAG: VanZ family protein [Eubacteriales bacterium]|nr:VanZ family protein [Eubacteriales bacterium]MDD3881276.1 VanZ family protein [Eubacteriales bacterium]MDD4512194.1 VanZ family protein [Eubacteriales bacterium]
MLLCVVVFKFRGSFTELGDKIAATSFDTNNNFVPFRTIGVQLAHISEGWAKFNLLGNTIPFIPFGFLLPIVYKKASSFKRVFIIGLIFIILIEIIQFATRLGSFDVDDILLNMLGILFGCAVYMTQRKRRKAKQSAK